MKCSKLGIGECKSLAGCEGFNYLLRIVDCVFIGSLAHSWTSVKLVSSWKGNESRAIDAIAWIGA